MEKRITSIKYNAGKLESTKRIVTFAFFIAVMVYSVIKGNLRWDKDSLFFYAFFGFSVFIVAVSMAGYKKERIRILSASSWKYRLYKRTNAVVYFLTRGMITSLIFTGLFALMLVRNKDFDVMMNNLGTLAISFIALMIISGTYHLLIMTYILKKGRPVYD